MVNDRHRAFARAVVALAREHRMDRLQLSFRESFGGMNAPADHCAEEVSMSWAEGRHGARARIGLRVQAHDSIEEAGARDDS